MYIKPVYLNYFKYDNLKKRYRINKLLYEIESRFHLKLADVSFNLDLKDSQEVSEAFNKKIEMLTEVLNGKKITDIPNFYNAFEKRPIEGINSKKSKVRELYLQMYPYLPVVQRELFDLESTELLDEKIEILTGLLEGKSVYNLEILENGETDLYIYEIFEKEPNKDIINKQITVLKLWDKVRSEWILPVGLSNFFDISSYELLDEKIEVLTALIKGKNYGAIQNFYDILEDYPKTDAFFSSIEVLW